MDLRKGEKLYHGSAWRNVVLKPGIHYGGVEKQWDETESNRFLYATRDRNLAVAMGMVGLLEDYAFDRFHYGEDGINIETDTDAGVILRGLEGKYVYLYVIVVREDQGWVKVRNKHNNAVDEWKTDTVLSEGWEIEDVRVTEWLRQNRFRITTAALLKRSKKISALEWFTQ